MTRKIRNVLAAALYATLASGVAIPAHAAIVIRDVTDPPPTFWNWGSGDIVITDSVCVGTDQSGFLARWYRIGAWGTGAGGSFFLQGPAPAAGDVLSYTVQWAWSAGQTSGTNLPPLTWQIAFMNPSLDLNCQTAGVNATVIVTIPQADLLAAPAGVYTGTLYLIVAPL